MKFGEFILTNGEGGLVNQFNAAHDSKSGKFASKTGGGSASSGAGSGAPSEGRTGSMSIGSVANLTGDRLRSAGFMETSNRRGDAMINWERSVANDSNARGDVSKTPVSVVKTRSDTRSSFGDDGWHAGKEFREGTFNGASQQFTKGQGFHAEADSKLRSLGFDRTKETARTFKPGSTKEGFESSLLEAKYKHPNGMTAAVLADRERTVVSTETPARRKS